jgi:hypothetical protein
MEFEIVKELGTLSESSKGWAKKLTVVKWYNGKPKLDIRSWNEDMTKMGKGITLSYEEAQLLLRSLTDCVDDLDELGVE